VPCWLLGTIRTGKNVKGVSIMIRKIYESNAEEDDFRILIERLKNALNL